MMQFMKWITLVLCLSFLQTSYATESPAGYWKTIDDKTGQPKSILKVWVAPDHKLYGQVVKLFPRAGQDENPVCKSCSGELRDQPILDMVVMEGLGQDQKNPAEWNGGSILDPQNGKSYSCFVQLKNEGKELKVRGYIGVALLGRTQTWQRVENPHG